MKELRGLRYAKPSNVWLQKEIVDVLPWLDFKQTAEWYEKYGPLLDLRPLPDIALLGCNDRFFLLTWLLHRTDLLHPWLFDRCREVEAEPDGRIDLWARYHGKSSIITTGGIIQEVCCDPNTTIAIFSVTRPIAQEFLAQIKQEFESNEELKRAYEDILYENPRGINPKNGERPAKWSLARGITVRRDVRPKEATIEAHGLIDGQPTGRHFHHHVYDDIVTQDYLSDDQLKKTTERFQMADNLGTRYGTRKWIAGTRYHFADVYGTIMERGAAIPRIYPATLDGTINGELVLLSAAQWQNIIKQQGLKTISAQHLLNPVAGNEASFRSLWLRTYEIVPRILNIYILVDPSKGSGARSDRTAIAVVGIDPAGNKYLLDGSCHRMKLSERYELVKFYKARWESHPGVQSCKVGWERYGMQVDLEVVKDMQMRENDLFEIIELNTPKQGGHSKADRIERLEPDCRNGKFWLPAVVHHFEFGPKQGPFSHCCLWKVWDDKDEEEAKKHDVQHNHHVGQIVYRPMRGLTKMMQQHDNKRIVKPLRRLDENKDPYDLTRVFIEEYLRHPFAVHDDLIDAVSRIYDIEPIAPQAIDAKATDSIDMDLIEDVTIHDSPEGDDA